MKPSTVEAMESATRFALLDHPCVSAISDHPPEEFDVAVRAYRHYVEGGRPEGRSLDHWLRAENEVLVEPRFTVETSRTETEQEPS